MLRRSDGSRRVCPSSNSVLLIHSNDIDAEQAAGILNAHSLITYIKKRTLKCCNSKTTENFEKRQRTIPYIVQCTQWAVQCILIHTNFF